MRPVQQNSSGIFMREAYDDNLEDHVSDSDWSDSPCIEGACELYI
jgi:hypothetical protein